MSQRRLNKDESRQRYREGRRLWNKFDPIGVFKIDPQWPEDEYESYVGPLMRLCEDGKPASELQQYVETVVYGRIGLSRTPLSDKSIVEFAEQFLEWYNSNWPDTHV